MSTKRILYLFTLAFGAAVIAGAGTQPAPSTPASPDGASTSQQSAAAASATTKLPQPIQETRQRAVGTLEKVDAKAGTVVIETAPGVKETFVLDPSTRFRNEGAVVQLKDLQAGSRVVVVYEKNGEKLTATKVAMHKARSAEGKVRTKRSAATAKPTAPPPKAPGSSPPGH